MKFTFTYVNPKSKEVNTDRLSADCKAGQLLVAYHKAIAAIDDNVITVFKTEMAQQSLTKNMLTGMLADMLESLTSAPANKVRILLKQFIEGISLIDDCYGINDFKNDPSNSVSIALDNMADASEASTASASSSAPSTSSSLSQSADSLFSCKFNTFLHQEKKQAFLQSEKAEMRRFGVTANSLEEVEAQFNAHGINVDKLLFGKDGNAEATKNDSDKKSAANSNP